MPDPTDAELLTPDRVTSEAVVLDGSGADESAGGTEIESPGKIIRIGAMVKQPGNVATTRPRRLLLPMRCRQILCALRSLSFSLSMTPSPA